MLENEYLVLSGQVNISVINHLKVEIEKIRESDLKKARLKLEFKDC